MGKKGMTADFWDYLFLVFLGFIVFGALLAAFGSTGGERNEQANFLLKQTTLNDNLIHFLKRPLDVGYNDGDWYGSEINSSCKFKGSAIEPFITLDDKAVIDLLESFGESATVGDVIPLVKSPPRNYEEGKYCKALNFQTLFFNKNYGDLWRLNIKYSDGSSINYTFSKPPAVGTISAISYIPTKDNKNIKITLWTKK